VSTLK
jgi:hypothetical protein